MHLERAYEQCVDERPMPSDAYSLVASLYQSSVPRCADVVVRQAEPLGLGIGPKSATAPILVAEVAPAVIRGALVMQWQMWTAFGIMLGTVSSLIFYNVPDRSGIVGLNWRLMLGSAALPALIVMIQVWFVPESPRCSSSRSIRR